MQWWVNPAVFIGGALPWVLAEGGDSMPHWVRLLLGGVNMGLVALLGYKGRAPGTVKAEPAKDA